LSFDFVRAESSGVSFLRRPFRVRLLFLLGYLTKPEPKDRDRFFSQVLLPSAAENDAKAVEKRRTHPKFEGRALASAHWEIMKPDRRGYLGFFGT
jgi:hypothetical protein